MDILISVAGTVLGYIVVPIGRELGYLIFYQKNIEDLQEQLRTLQESRERVQNLVNVARSNAYEIYNNVSTWLDKVDVELQNMSQQNGGGSNMSDSKCLNLIICQPRKIKKRVEHILKLIDDGQWFDKDNVGRPAPLPDTKCPTLPADYQILESRTLIAKNIKDALADPNVNRVGVCGMGGVGKTKLLNEVKQLVLENNLFHRVIHVTVGLSKSVMDIQHEIGGMLNMNNLNENSMEVRASLLRTKLVEMKDNILIMLDDLWNEYDLEKEFGIPCRSESRKEGCKILMTSRSQDLLTNQMNTDQWFEVHSLSKEESWKFFVAIVGDFIEANIKHIANDVVKECGGLPIALKIIAKALKGKKVQVWKDALKKLKKHAFVSIQGVDKKLYNCLNFSYNLMEDEAKLLFRLCSVFPDDYMISMKDLQMYAMSMGLLNDINNWEDARNRVITLVDELKSSYLLLKSDVRDDHVQMHDVVRDFAKYVASEIEKMPSLSYGFGQTEWREEDRRGSYNSIFVYCKDFHNLPPRLDFPNLQLLILKNSIWNKKAFQIPDAFFEAMENLRVLDMTYMRLELSRSLLTHSIKNLQALSMFQCKCNDFDAVGELKNLKILRIEAIKIEELPKNMSQLTELKVLEVLDCSNLKLIHPNIISSMTKLEELSLCTSFNGWGDEVSYNNKLIKNVKLSEVDCLTHLSILRLEVLNVDVLSNELSLERTRQLEEFYIYVGDGRMMHTCFMKHATTLVLNIESKIVSIGGVLEILLQQCEHLEVKDSVNFIKALLRSNGNYGYPRLKYLDIHIIDENSDIPRQIIGKITPLFDVQALFSELKHLRIRGGNNVEMLWHNNGLIANSFCKLQEIWIHSCNKLRYVFPSHMVTSLVFLNKLRVNDCELLERIFEIEEPIDDVAKVVPLRTLILHALPNLKYIWNNDPGEQHLTFPKLKEVQVVECPQLKTLFPPSFIKHMGEMESLHAFGENEIFAEDEVSKLVFPEIVVFPSLRSLGIHSKVAEKSSFWVRSESFPKLQALKLLGSKDHDNMVSLLSEMSELVYNKVKELEIVGAFELVQVFKNKRSSAKLETLYLYNLPNLTHVWEEENTEIMTTSCSFENLKRIHIIRCSNLKCLLPSSITFFNLTYLTVDGVHVMKNLFSSSVANNLLNLKSMVICNSTMTSIVVSEEEEDEISFNRLNELTLSYLLRLVSFHSGINSRLKFPCLELLKIEGCYKMKTFSYGVISTSKLPFVNIEENEVPLSPTHDINLIIHNFFTQYQDEEEDIEEDSKE